MLRWYVTIVILVCWWWWLLLFATVCICRIIPMRALTHRISIIRWSLWKPLTCIDYWHALTISRFWSISWEKTLGYKWKFKQRRNKTKSRIQNHLFIVFDKIRPLRFNSKRMTSGISTTCNSSSLIKLCYYRDKDNNTKYTKTNKKINLNNQLTSGTLVTSSRAIS